MKRWIMLVPVMIAATAGALPEQNLVPNWDFSDKTNPLKGWRYTYPHEQQQYGRNHEYIKVTNYGGKRCAEFAVPKKQGNNGGAFLETAFIKCEPGATYKAEVECNPQEKMRIMIYIEAWVPLPEEAPGKPSLRIWPAEEGRPRLIMCHRKQAPRLTTSGWTTIRDTLTVPKSVDLNVNGKLTPTPPTYISIKAYTDLPVWRNRTGPIAETGTKHDDELTHSYVTNFRLTKVK
jgi:hypothetical protein